MRVILVFIMLLFSIAISRAASFSTAVAGSSQSGFALFNSNSPHVARNAKGTFIAYQVDANAAYTSNTEQVVWFAGDPAATSPVTLYEAASTSEPPCIVAAYTGEVFAINADWINNVITVQKWADVATSTTPQTFTFTGRPQRGNGKFTCAWDEQRRSIFFVGDGGEIVQIGENGGLIAATPIFSQGTYPMQYPNIYIAPDGQVDLAWVTVDTSFTAAPQYRSIEYMGSRGPSSAWSTNGNAPWAWAAPAAPILPDEGGPAWLVTYTSEMLSGQNKFLISMISDNVGSVHFVFGVSPTADERCFATGGNRCTLAYVRKNRLTQDKNPTAIARPLRTQSIFPHGDFGGLITIRGNQLYFITAYEDQLVAIVSSDWGNTWQDLTSMIIPNVAGACVKDLNGDRGQSTDADIIGSFTIWRGGDCTAWAAATGPTGPTDIVFWRLGF